MAAVDTRPPLVVGYEEHPFIIYEPEPPRQFYCPIHAPHLHWPSHTEPIWRGEVPEGASCKVCGIELSELE
jgi:hypothetical protein